MLSNGDSRGLAAEMHHHIAASMHGPESEPMTARLFADLAAGCLLVSLALDSGADASDILTGRGLRKALRSRSFKRHLAGPGGRLALHGA